MTDKYFVIMIAVVVIVGGVVAVAGELKDVAMGNCEPPTLYYDSKANIVCYELAGDLHCSLLEELEELDVLRE
jgi:hypothetical protein